MLADLDDFAIKELRRKRLVWSGFGPANRIEPDFLLEKTKETSIPGRGVRIINFSNTRALDRWCASLLWRAAVSRLPEMSQISVSVHQIDFLASYVLGRSDENPFPVTFTQLNSRGPIHNQTPTAETVCPPNSTGLAPWRIFRFYLDGLLIHFQRDESVSERQGKLILGSDDETAVICVPFVESFQAERLIGLIEETHRQFPNAIPRPKPKPKDR